jgi:hypothetical protein
VDLTKISVPVPVPVTQFIRFGPEPTDRGDSLRVVAPLGEAAGRMDVTVAGPPA